MTKGIAYDLTSGMIMANYGIPDEATLATQVQPGQGYKLGNYDSLTTYFPEGIETLRPEFSITCSSNKLTADMSDSLTIDGIPSGAVITDRVHILTGRVRHITRTIGTADGTTTTYMTDIEGEHTLEIVLDPYQPMEIIIDAV